CLSTILQEADLIILPTIQEKPHERVHYLGVVDHQYLAHALFPPAWKQRIPHCAGRIPNANAPNGRRFWVRSRITLDIRDQYSRVVMTLTELLHEPCT